MQNVEALCAEVHQLRAKLAAVMEARDNELHFLSYPSICYAPQAPIRVILCASQEEESSESLEDNDSDEEDGSAEDEQDEQDEQDDDEQDDDE